MTAKTTRTTTTTETESMPGQMATADMARQQLAAMADGASALLRATEVLGQVQQQAVQRAALMQQQTAEKIRSIGSPAELVTIQTGLLVSGMQEAVQYWQELTAAAMRVQAEMAGRVGQQQQQQQSAGSNAAGAALNPMVQVWQNMFAAPLNSISAAATAH